MENNKKYILREYFSLCPDGVCQDLLTEEEKKDIRDNGALYLSGIFQKADEKNQNGRIYPYEVLESEVKNYEKLIRENRSVGELNHPDSSEIDAKNLSHVIKKLWWEGKNLYGKLKVLSGPSGQILKSLINDGIKIGISSRGLGSVHEKGEDIIVEDDFQLICFDIVTEPSTVDAFLMKESKQKTSLYFTRSDKINRILNSILYKGEK
ncbi:primosomal protein [Candidatus Pacearchaeota archaeon]|nr:primosomal protein [Candidatus Pacearchaeota archaeon]